MIYFDNAATTMQKPPEVAQALMEALGSFGGPGRGSHAAALAADRAVHRARVQLAKLFNAPDPTCVAFAPNATAALNVAIVGLLDPGDHAVATAAAHNSVLRPLYRAQAAGEAELTIVPIAQDGSLDYDAFARAFTPRTRLAVISHASNLTGDVYDLPRLADIAHEHGAWVVVDAAQTAGSLSIDLARDGADVVCFTGHKGLFGPQGTGGLVLNGNVPVRSLVVGGSGVRSFDTCHPDFMPERLEAGTLNAHGIAGLSAGIAFIEREGQAALHAKTLGLTERFERGVRAVPGVTVYGGHASPERCGIVALNIGDVDSSDIGQLLDRDYGICVRAGAHCAPLMHKALGTADRGAVRFSFSPFNTPSEVDAGIAAVTELARDLG